jgi:hypothetical protein
VYLRELSTICLKPLRIAFDHLGLRKPYTEAVRIAHDYGLNELSNYMLYNFHDSPTDLYERMRINVDLNEELGIRIWSFPMRYQPTDRPDRGHIGDKWSRYQLRSMQIVLQATHGVVSGNPEFFFEAFGDSVERFHEILLYPHHYIFNRFWYKTQGGRAELKEYLAKMARLSPSENTELLALLSSVDPRDFRKLVTKTTNRAVSDVLTHYVPLSKEKEEQLWSKASTNITKHTEIPDDERVEDAGLSEEVVGGTSRSLEGQLSLL